VNGMWYDAPLKEGVAFNSEGFNLVSNQTESQTISLDIFKEELSAGNYRIIKVVRDYAKNKT
jgi:hypothetical protein